MKKLLLIIIILLLSKNLYSQDFEPTQHKFYFQGDSVLLNADMDYFKQVRFILGWHWDSRKKISQSLFANQQDIYRGHLLEHSIDSNCYYTLKPEGYSHAVGEELFSVRAMQFEPTLKIDSLNPETINFRYGDSTRPVFGFKHIRGYIPSDPNDENYSRLIIAGDSLINQVVLAEPWPSNQLSLFGYHFNEISQRIRIMNSHLCRNLYFSINLRNIEDCSGSGTDTILKIELPYTIHQGTGANIRFQSVPSPYPDSVHILANNRGILRDTIPASPDTRTIYITQNMIPQNHKDITISAFMKFDGENDSLVWGNYELKDGSPDAQIAGKIDSIKIEITYLGGCPIAIDWVRLETPHAREFLSGKFDDVITTSVQEDLNKFLSSDFYDRGHRLFRYNAIIEGKVFNWIGEKYFNKLIGNINTNENDHIIWPSLYEYYTNTPTRLYGLYRLQPHISAPFSRKSYLETEQNRIKSLNIINGYMGYNESTRNQNPATYESDPGKCHYETFLINQASPVPITSFINEGFDLSLYKQILSTENNFWRASYLVRVEEMVYNHFVQNGNSAFLFSDRPWWAQGFLHYGIEYKTTYLDSVDLRLNNAAVFSERPWTGDELRLFISLPLLLGAKGILYDGPQTANDTTKPFMYDADQLNQAVRDSIELLSDKDFVESDLSGPDFIRQSGEIFNLNTKFYPLDTVAKYLDRSTDRLYFGRKTMRTQMRKLHSWIRTIDTTLMKLKLQAWLAKGYARWYQQDPNLQEHLMSQIINESGIKTRSLLSTNYEGTGQFNYRDSSFYDITLLRDNVNDSLMTKTLYLGIQNRRTNPLVMEQDTLRFYTTAEFDKFVKKGGKTLQGNLRDSSYWQDLYWKRLGCREITIPFNIPISRNKLKFDGQLFRVRDLGYDKSIAYDTDEYPWRDERYYDLTDTIISSKSDLAIRFLPGEGKLLEISKIFVESMHDSTSNNPCTVCDSIINSGNFFFRAETNPELLDCCTEIYYDYFGSCNFKNFPISIEFSPLNDNVSFFPNTSNADYLEHKHGYNELRTWLLRELTYGSGYLGTICLGRPRFPVENFIYQVKAGGQTESDTSICLYDHYFDMTCDNTNELNCCDSLEIILSCSLNLPNPHFPDSCLFEIAFNQYIVGCTPIHGITVNRYSNNHFTGEIKEIGVPYDPNTPIELRDYKGVLYKPISHFTSAGYNYCFEFLFYDSSGDVACEKTVCLRYDDVSSRNFINDCLIYHVYKVSEIEYSANKEFQISASPNPLNYETTINFSIPEKKNVAIDIFNLIGEKVLEVTNAAFDSGDHSILLNSNNLSSGVYLLSMSYGTKNKTIKLTIIK